MVHQPLANTSEGCPYGDTEVAQMADRSDARPQQHRRRMNSPTAQNYLIASKLHCLMADHGANADTACIFEQEFTDLRLSLHVEIVALPDRGSEVGDRCRDAPIIQVGHGQWVISVLEFPVLVRQVTVARELERFRHRLCVVRPVLREDPPYRDTAFSTVQRPVEVDVALDLLEVGEDGFPAPAAGAALLPFIVIMGSPPVGQLTVVRGPASQDTCLLIANETRTWRVRIVVRHGLSGDAQVAPYEAWITRGKSRTTVEDGLRDAAVRRVLPRFAQQDLIGASCGKPAGKNGPCRSASHNDVIVDLLHRRFLRGDVIVTGYIGFKAAGRRDRRTPIAAKVMALVPFG